MTRIVRFADDSGDVHTGVADGTGRIRAFDGAPRIADLLRLPAGELRSLTDRTAAGNQAGFTERERPAAAAHGRADGVVGGRCHLRTVAGGPGRREHRTVHLRADLRGRAARTVLQGAALAGRDRRRTDRRTRRLAPQRPRTGTRTGPQPAAARRSVIWWPTTSARARSRARTRSTSRRPRSTAGAPRSPRASSPPGRSTTRPRCGSTSSCAATAPSPSRATTTTAAFHRDPLALPAYLWHGQPFPDGAVLCTGTGIVPEMDFTLSDGDTRGDHDRGGGCADQSGRGRPGEAGLARRGDRPPAGPPRPAGPPPLTAPAGGGP